MAPSTHIQMQMRTVLQGVARFTGQVVEMEPKHDSTSAGTELGSCSCCVHANCASLKEHHLCSCWYFLRWQGSSSALPLDMLRELRSQLGGKEFTMQPVMWTTGALEALIKIESGSGAQGMLSPCLLPLTQSSFFIAGKSGVWKLPCCWDAVTWNVPLWLARFRPGDEKAVLGDTNLGKLLLEEIRGAAEGKRSAASK